MDPQEIDVALDELENRLDRLRSLYEQYFLGIEKIEPQVARKDVDRRFWILRRIQIRNTARRFRMQVLIQRYNTFQQYWARICREIENGTYTRHLLKAQKKLGEEPKTWAAKRRLGYFRRGQTTTEEGGAEPAAVSDSGAPAVNGAPSSAPPTAQTSDSPAAATFDRASPPASPIPPVRPRPGERESVAPRSADLGRLDLDLEDGSAPPRLPVAAPPLPAKPPRARLPAAPAAAARPAIARPAPGVQPAAPPRAESPLPRPPQGPAPDPLKAPGTAPRPPLARAAAASPAAPNAPGVRPASTAVPTAARTQAPAIPPGQPRSAAAAQPALPKPNPQARPPVSPQPVAPRAAAQPSPQKAPTPAVAKPSSPEPARAPAPAAAKAAAPQQAGALSDERVRQLHVDLVSAKRNLNQGDAVSIDALARTLRETERKLRAQHQGRSVDFQIVVKDGKAVLKPVVRK